MDVDQVVQSLHSISLHNENKKGFFSTIPLLSLKQACVLLKVVNAKMKHKVTVSCN